MLSAIIKFMQIHCYGAAWGAATPCLRRCRQISKISAFVGKSRMAGGVREASLFVPILSTIP